ncbi:hypothetical protein [Xanthobacter autotrophicus]|uniref:hypothetical protein n=1 Tax=Xanthobacter autotrophicus TaxID=280 RepID=UPI003726B629
MTTYTITVGDGTGTLLDGYYGLYPEVPGYIPALGSVSPEGGAVYGFVWNADGSDIQIAAAPVTADLTVTWLGHDYVCTYDGDGYAQYTGPGLGGPYPTAGTTTFDTDEVAPPEHTFIGAAGAYALTGYPATLARGGGRTLAADPGIYALTGYDAALTKGFAGTITVGSFSGFIYGYQQGAYGSISWASGSAPSGAPTQIAWTSGGFSVQMAGPRPAQIILNGKTYALTGYDGSYTRSGAGLAGPYPTSGTVDILFSYGQDYRFGGVAGAYALTGMDAVLSVGAATLEAIAAAAGSYVLAGYDATLSQGGARTLAADAGSYVLTGMDAALGKASNHVLAADAGSYVLTGGAAVLYIMETEMTVPWPETLPCQPEQGTWNETPQADVVSFRPESGPTILRRRSTVQGIVAQSTWVFTAAEYAAFRTFYRSDLQGGAIRFALDHPVTGDPTEWVFEAEPQMTATTNRRVRVQMQWRGLS